MADFAPGTREHGILELTREHVTPLQRQLRGNLPQAFVHALLLETAHELGRAGVGVEGFDAAQR